MRYRLIRYSEVNTKINKVPLFLFHVLQKKGNVVEEPRPPDGGVRFTILKEVSGVFFCYEKIDGGSPGYTPQTYEYIAIPETHPLFNFKHASRNAPGRDDAVYRNSQSRQLMELQVFSIKEVQKLQELFPIT